MTHFKCSCINVSGFLCLPFFRFYAKYKWSKSDLFEFNVVFFKLGLEVLQHTNYRKGHSGKCKGNEGLVLKI